MRRTFLVASIAFLLLASSALATPDDDRFIAGYASAVLETEFHLPPASIEVSDGMIRVTAPGLSADDRDRVVTALKRIHGVTSVEVVDQRPAPVPAAPNEPTERPGGDGVRAKVEERKWRLFAPTEAFGPLLADPRWPNFSAAYDRYTAGHQKLRDVASVSFGESISLYQSPLRNWGQFEVGVQASVYAIFNLNAVSHDLVNADYFVGPIAEYRKDDFSAFLRVFHQSSHLGDEFILDHPGIQRVNLSYEEVDAIASYDLFEKTIRIYGGGGYLFDTDPSSVKKLAAQYGFEYHGPRIIPTVGMTPIVALDLQNRENNNWSLDISARAGVQFEDPAALSRRVQLLFEYYNGHTPNGQFFNERVQFVGLGLHFYP